MLLCPLPQCQQYRSKEKGEGGCKMKGKHMHTTKLDSSPSCSLPTLCLSGSASKMATNIVLHMLLVAILQEWKFIPLSQRTLVGSQDRIGLTLSDKYRRAA